MWDIFLDTLIDSVKMLPFLFGAYLLIEYIEHKASDKLKHVLSHSGRYGSVAGALLGCVPQCGFSVAAANLYAGRVITLGTLIAVFLSTSDEAIPLLLTDPKNGKIILLLIGVKVIIAIVAGMLIDLVLHKRRDTLEIDTHDLCKDCDCEHGILKSTIHHTVSIFIFVFVISFVLHLGIDAIGEEQLSAILLQNSIFQPAIAALIGFIPNCASSVILTQFYMAGQLSFGAVTAGLCTGAGIGLIVLFKANKHWKENLMIMLIMYGVSTAAGMILQVCIG